jgi:hypothetical protein
MRSSLNVFADGPAAFATLTPTPLRKRADDPSAAGKGTGTQSVRGTCRDVRSDSPALWSSTTTVVVTQTMGSDSGDGGGGSSKMIWYSPFWLCVSNSRLKSAQLLVA